MDRIFHAVVLNLHQPSGNLQHLFDHNKWEAKEILFSLDRIPRSLWQDSDIARVHLSLSGTLLETLADPGFQAAAYGTIDCGSFLWHLQNEQIFEILGTAYYHPVLPLIPAADREEQIKRWLGRGQHLFWRHHFNGFWPPEMGFSMELIPLLKRYGYKYVLIDSENIRPVDPMSWQELRYRPHLARYGEDEIIVIVRDRDLSNAQESGMDYGWFYREVQERTNGCAFPPLVTTCTDGDNGGWFRNTNPQANFWGSFYPELLAHARAGTGNIQPGFITDYLHQYGAHGYVEVETAAWNTGWHHGRGFVQWTGSQAQKDAIGRVELTSAAIHQTARELAAAKTPDHHPACSELENSLWHMLRAETSCNFFWGEDWVHKCHADLDTAWSYLHRVRQG
ncbi:MAG: hypothetical protein WGN25_15045 [Candidatus Electrothrix sp. GW3-4]|uniref:hypothetical protein n=1 Tax=Candidatus Electrothrix sp. GW3-4 TaxID=3126740 RepID=UPI0030CD193B